MAPPLNRNWFDTLIDDDGSGTVGTPWNKSQVDGLLDTVDASLAGLVDKSGAPGANAVALFNDADTLRADAGLTHAGGVLAVPLSLRVGANPATTGTVGLPKSGSVYARNQGNSADVRLIATDGNDLPWVGQSDRGVYFPGGRLAFPATPVPSSDPSTLDDYGERYSVQPTIGADGGASGQTYAIQTCEVTKVGRVAIANGRLALTNKGTLSGNVLLRGLPFTTGAVWAPVALVVTQFFGFAAGVAWLGGYANPSTTDITLTKNGTGSTGTLVAADLTNTAEIMFVAIYTTL